MRPTPFMCADIEGVLGAAIAGTFALELAVDLLLGLGLLQRHDLGFGEDKALLAILASSALSRVLGVRQIVRNQTVRTPNGEIDKPCFFSSLATRTWPQVGCSIASATAAASTSGATRFLRIGFLRLISCSASSPPFLQLLEPVEAVATISHHLAGLADIAQLLGEFQHADLGPDDLLFLRHEVSSCAGAGGAARERHLG